MGARTARRASSRRTATCSRRGWTRAGARTRGSSSPGMRCASRSSCATCTRMPPPAGSKRGAHGTTRSCRPTDAQLVDAWFRLGFGQQQALECRRCRTRTRSPSLAGFAIGPPRPGHSGGNSSTSTSRFRAISRARRCSPSRIRDDREESREEWLKTLAGTDDGDPDRLPGRPPGRLLVNRRGPSTVPPLLRARRFRRTPATSRSRSPCPRLAVRASASR